MKEDLNIQQLAAEIVRQADNAIDVTAPTSAVRMVTSVNEGASRSYLTFDVPNPQDLGLASELVGVSDITHRQIGAHLQVPAKFYDRLRNDQPDMLDFNVNELFQRVPTNRLVRTLDGEARAFLSNTYNVGLSNKALAEYLLPEVGALGGVVRSSSLTTRKAYVKIVLPTIEREVRRVGDIVRLGVVLYNSEIGFGKWGFDLFTENLTCTNGMTCENTGFAKAHLGKSLGDGATVRRFLTEGTRQLEDKALLSGTRDVLRGLLTEETLEAHVSKLEEAAATPIVERGGDRQEKVAERVTVIGKQVGLSEEENASVLDHLIAGGNLTLYGLAQAVTRTAEDVPTYDRASELERLGGQIATLPRKQWGIEGDEVAVTNAQ